MQREVRCVLPYENIDRLLLVECRPHDLVQGVIPKLYAEIRRENPVTYEIAQVLTSLPQGRAAIVSGVVLPRYLPHGEIDGLIGAVWLGGVLQRLGHTVDILVETEVAPVIKALAGEVDLAVGIRETSHKARGEFRKWAPDYSLAIAIEKVGRNRKGVRHSIMGTPLAADDGLVDDLFLEMAAQKKMTIGIGDGGNEIGFGAIFEAARRLVPKGSACGCPCEDGIVTATPTTLLLPVAVSNYGAYGIAAALAAWHKDPSLAAEGPVIRRLIEVAIASGAIDGGTADPSFIGDDGIPIEGVVAFVTLLRTIVTQWFKSFGRHF
jgi:hypothetical protein